jgi:TPR repeat protein
VAPPKPTPSVRGAQATASSRAAEQRNAAAQCNLGFCYERGQGVAADAREAVVWYRRAAEQGNVKAQFNLAVCYELGRGVDADAREAVAWYRRAAEQGYAGAQYNLGYSYAYGKGVVNGVNYFLRVWRKEWGSRNKTCRRS